MTISISSNEARVKCDQCGAIHTLALTTEEVDREERQMGAQVQYDTTDETSCDCGQLIEYVQSDWEYPEGVRNSSEGPTVRGGTLLP